MIRRLIYFFVLAACALAADPKVEILWPGGAPGAVGNEDLDRPELTLFLPVSPTAAVVVCPGGGYDHLSMDREGKQVAEWFNKIGVAAFLLKYRYGPRYRHPAPLQDARRAIRTVRARAAEFVIPPDRIGIIGFSAGGHLASTAGTHFDAGNPGAADPIERVSSRPDFMILAYLVITLEDPYAHKGSRNFLLGPNPDPKLIEDLSNEKQVTPQTPPTFLFHGNSDSAVPPENSIHFYLALRKAKVPAEVHIYERVPHGIALAPNDPIVVTWLDRLTAWLHIHGLLAKP